MLYQTSETTLVRFFLLTNISWTNHHMLSAVLGGRVLEEKLNSHESCVGKIYDAGRRYTHVYLYIHILLSYSYLIVVKKTRML